MDQSLWIFFDKIVLIRIIKTTMFKVIEMSKLLVDMVDLIYLMYRSSVFYIIIIIIFNQIINEPKFPSPKLVVTMPKKGVF